MFRIEKVKDYSVLSKKAAMLIAAEITQREHPVLGLATGSTPIGAYQVLRELYQEGRLDFSAVRTVNLDEYRGLAPEDSHSYRYFMNQELFQHVNIPMENTAVPNGLLEDANKACLEYEALIRKLGGIHLQILGLGHDGHIGFNEPSDSFPRETHCVQLAEETIEANQRFFSSKEEVPKEAYTMGIRHHYESQKNSLNGFRKDKADIFAESIGRTGYPLRPRFHSTIPPPMLPYLQMSRFK